jgi:hypothetical protein
MRGVVVGAVVEQSALAGDGTVLVRRFPMPRDRRIMGFRGCSRDSMEKFGWSKDLLAFRLNRTIISRLRQGLTGRDGGMSGGVG